MMPSPPPPLSRPLIKAEYDWREGRPHILMQLSLPLFRQTERKQYRPNSTNVRESGKFFRLCSKFRLHGSKSTRSENTVQANEL